MITSINEFKKIFENKEESFYIEFLNKDKNFQKDKKIFTGPNAFDDAKTQGKENLENFTIEMIQQNRVVESVLDYKNDIQSVFPDMSEEEIAEFDSMFVDTESFIKDDIMYSIEEIKETNPEFDILNIMFDDFYTMMEEFYIDGKIDMDYSKQEYKNVFLKIKEIAKNPNQLKLFNENINDDDDYDEDYQTQQIISFKGKRVNDVYKMVKGYDNYECKVQTKDDIYVIDDINDLRHDLNNIIITLTDTNKEPYDVNVSDIEKIIINNINNVNYLYNENTTFNVPTTISIYVVLDGNNKPVAMQNNRVDAVRKRNSNPEYNMYTVNVDRNLQNNNKITLDNISEYIDKDNIRTIQENREEDLYHEINQNDVEQRFNTQVKDNIGTENAGYSNAFNFIKEEIQKYKMLN